MRKAKISVHIICIVLLLWCIVSWTNVMWHNLTGARLAMWNVFGIISRMTSGMM